MFKKAMLFLGVLLMASAFAYAEDKFTVSGGVTFSKDADIHLFLKTQNEEEKGETTPSSRTVIIRPTTEQKKAKRASFNFIAVPKGAYIIRCFQDVNGNGKLDLGDPTEPAAIRDRDMRVSLEPEGLYKSSWPFDWDRSKFQVNRDITGIKIHLQK